ncbi:TspO/MBR family protein [Sporobolomyces koalae]|uniref:TspO/MBR family protein n=1 Tax=Sporobolomyces koalae TaxID=500713 RepID=UPI00317D0F40
MPIQLPSLFYDIARTPAVAVGIPLVFGMLNGRITKTSVNTWYPTLRRPAIEPPRWAFPVCWTALYVAMGLASHLLVKKHDAALPGSPLKAAADHAFKLYWLQFALNQAWTPLFFGFKQVGLAFLDIGLLTSTTFALTYEAYKVDPRTAYLLVPYCAWLSLASYLNGKSRLFKNFLCVPARVPVSLANDL